MTFEFKISFALHCLFNNGLLKYFFKLILFKLFVTGEGRCRTWHLKILGLKMFSGHF